MILVAGLLERKLKVISIEPVKSVTMMKTECMCHQALWSLCIAQERDKKSLQDILWSVRSESLIGQNNARDLLLGSWQSTMPNLTSCALLIQELYMLKCDFCIPDFLCSSHVLYKQPQTNLYMI